MRECGIEVANGRDSCIDYGIDSFTFSGTPLLIAIEKREPPIAVRDRFVARMRFNFVEMASARAHNR